MPTRTRVTRQDAVNVKSSATTYTPELSQGLQRVRERAVELVVSQVQVSARNNNGFTYGSESGVHEAHKRAQGTVLTLTTAGHQALTVECH